MGPSSLQDCQDALALLLELAKPVEAWVESASLRKELFLYIGGLVSGCPCNKSPTVLGSIFAPLSLRNSQMGFLSYPHQRTHVAGLEVPTEKRVFGVCFRLAMSGSTASDVARW